MYPFHDIIWKGVLTVVLGVSATFYGVLGRLLFMADASGQALYATDPSVMHPIDFANLSVVVGTVTSILGMIWTWFLRQKSIAEEFRRKDEESTRESAREQRERDRMTDIRLMLAEGLAKVEVQHAALATTLHDVVSGKTPPVETPK